MTTARAVEPTQTPPAANGATVTALPPDAGPQEWAAHQAVAANSSHIRFTVAHTAVDISLPPVDKLAFYAGLGGAAALGIIDWPIAALTTIGHLLSDDRRNRTLRALGEALDAVT
jgi:hypothetical protein